MKTKSDNIIASGTCGENLQWVITGEKDNYTLTISGTGEMKDFDDSHLPSWNDYCKFIKTIEINFGVTSIGDSAFEDCSGLTSITISDSVTSIGENGFKGCYRLTEITIPDSVTSIGDSAFYGCDRLTSITIPDSVFSIGYNAFEYCSGLAEIYMKAQNPPLLGYSNVFDDVFDTISVYVPYGSKTDYENAKGWNKFHNIREDYRNRK
jgi:hypothetical protein